MDRGRHRLRGAAVDDRRSPHPGTDPGPVVAPAAAHPCRYRRGRPLRRHPPGRLRRRRDHDARRYRGVVEAAEADRPARLRQLAALHRLLELAQGPPDAGRVLARHGDPGHVRRGDRGQRAVFPEDRPETEGRAAARLRPDRADERMAAEPAHPEQVGDSARSLAAAELPKAMRRTSPRTRSTTLAIATPSPGSPGSRGSPTTRTRSSARSRASRICGIRRSTAGSG